jgi:PPOX class probable F420-dependent enzyme
MTTIPESHQDLLRSQFATLATIDDDGYPQLTEVIFLYDDEDGKVKFSLNRARYKTQYLEKRPKCSVFLLDLENPQRFLELRGRADVAPDPDYVFADRVGAKYGGMDLRRMDQPGESRVVVTVEPVRVHAWTTPSRS